ncbi:MAG: hydrogenase expression/formation protein HupK [Paracoccaceae bacterium]|nr:hydrogenase expression/formation protein HupK [Paracoccaceae bacterium]
MQASAPYPALRAQAAPALPVAAMVLGKPVEEAAEVLPRLFNLCRVAQGIAARAAFGLPVPSDWQDDLRAEILREHIVKLCLKWPALLSLPALPLPRDWMRGGPALREALFGPTGHLPGTPAAFEAFLLSSDGVAPILRAISQVFAPREACRAPLPAATPERFFHAGQKENSVTTRQAAHPVLAAIEARNGRGPLWSAVALAYDLYAVLDGTLPKARLTPGRAVIPAARGLYGLTARVEDGRVMAFERVTPTDHLLAPGGALDQSLATLPGARAAALGPLLMAILDPCYPVTLQPARQKESVHA